MIQLILNYLSYALSASIKVLFLKNKYDLIFIYEPSPITVAIPAIILKKINHTPIILWVTDLWPESVVSSGNLKSNLIPRFLTPVIKFIYRHCDKILVSSNGFIDSIKAKGIDSGKIEFFPQWAEPLFKPVKKNPELLGDLVPKNSFKVMFAGNIGEAQDFPAILNTAKLLKNNKNIHWIIIGDGRQSNWVKSKIDEYKLHGCFHMLGQHPIESMPEYYAVADAMLFTLKDEYIFSITIPAKVQSYLACGKPILAMVNGEASSIIKGSDAGYTCDAGDYRSLADNVIKMSGLDNSDLEKMAANSLKCYKINFEREMLLRKAENTFYQTIKSSRN